MKNKWSYEDEDLKWRLWMDRKGFTTTLFSTSNLKKSSKLSKGRISDQECKNDISFIDLKFPDLHENTIHAQITN